METYIGLILSVLLNIISLVLIGRYRVQENEKDVTEEEIRQMVDAGGDSGTIDENVKEMLNNIFELSNSSAGDIATHRTDIVAVPVDATLEEIKTSRRRKNIPVSWCMMIISIILSGCTM